jgi:hypothetical protein
MRWPFIFPGTICIGLLEPYTSFRGIYAGTHDAITRERFEISLELLVS